MAVFYFTTNGDEWFKYSAPDNLNDSKSIDDANANCDVTATPIPGGSLNPSFLPRTEVTMAWLTPVSECEWAGIACRVDTNCVDHIEVGALSSFKLLETNDKVSVSYSIMVLQTTTFISFNSIFIISPLSFTSIKTLEYYNINTTQSILSLPSYLQYSE